MSSDERAGVAHSRSQDCSNAAQRARRRMTLLDVMILAGATALGLASVQLGGPMEVDAAKFLAWPVAPSGYSTKRWLVPYAERAVPFLPCLAAWTGAFLVTRLRGPRPRWRRLVLQPGFVGAVAVLAVLAVEAPMLVWGAKIDGRFGWSSPDRVARFVQNGVVLLAHHAGWAVAVAWLTLALGGRWRPERSWVDRCGRVLGCVWIMIGPLASLLINHSTWWGNYVSG
jgi:hypothetical protein